MATEEIEITIKIVCSELPETWRHGLHLGLQRDNVMTDATPATSKRIVFKPTLRARRNSDGSVNFLGPYAHGPKSERFIYLNWLTIEGDMPQSMVGRIKLHLNHIRWTTVEKAAKANKPIRVKLALTNAKGGPVMASVRPDVAKWVLV
jgi:hypothetical protein